VLERCLHFDSVENLTPPFSRKETISFLSKCHFEGRGNYKILATFLDNALNCTMIVESSVGEQGVLTERESNCNQITRVEVESLLLFSTFLVLLEPSPVWSPVQGKISFL
jgi:hypothetical protein